MPSKNSINKPKDKILKNSHAGTIGKRRASRGNSQSRSSTSRYNDEATPKPTESKAVALYGAKIPETATVTNKRLSNKRAKKLDRNKKYIQRRNELLNIDLMAQDEGMQVDKAKPVKEATETEKIKTALWTLVDNQDKVSEVFRVDADAVGTTVGVQAF